jgi:hypothetical protein
MITSNGPSDLLLSFPWSNSLNILHICTLSLTWIPSSWCYPWWPCSRSLVSWFDIYNNN